VYRSVQTDVQLGILRSRAETVPYCLAPQLGQKLAAVGILEPQVTQNLVSAGGSGGDAAEGVGAGATGLKYRSTSGVRSGRESVRNDR